MAHQYADKYVRSPSDIPSQEHWAIIKGSSVHHEGDERSRTAPEHGYPAYTEQIVEYEAYLTEEKFKQAMEHKLSSPYPEHVIGIHIDKVYTSKMKIELV
jgi:hypothetical protein